MRLLQRNEGGEFSLTGFVDGNIPPYAILSHVWDDEEVTLEDIMNGTGKDKKGYRKLIFCANQAAKDGLRYFWIDACCIDQSNMADKEKSISSMSAWYSNATHCYVYLSDVAAGTQLKQSRLFTRGSTLQKEVIAPASVKFFSREGQYIGDTTSLRQIIDDMHNTSTGARVSAALDLDSDDGSDIDSVFSDSASSVSSASTTSLNPVQTFGIHEVSRALLSEETLKATYTLAISSVDRRKARLHIRGFLRDYGGDLLREASDSGLAIQAAKFVRELAGRITDEIIWSITESAEVPKSLNGKAEKQDLENWLSTIQGNICVEERIQPSLEADGDESSDEELNDDLSFPHIDLVKDFLINSEAFQRLVLAMQTWLKIDGVDRKNIVGSGTDTPNQTDRMVMTEGVPRDTIASIEDQDQTGSRNQALPAVIDVHQQQDAVQQQARRIRSRQHGGSFRDIFSSLLNFWGVAFYLYDIVELFIPHVPQGYRRLRWRCSCNTILWGDFPVEDTAAFDQLKRQLSLEITSPFKYFEVCVSTGNHAIDHHEVDISRISSDNELFEMIWDKYNISRGIGLRRLFLRPSDVNFVMFSVSQRNQYGAGIHKKPDEFPPQEELDEKRYHYLCPRIRMPVNVFLHYLHRARWNIWGEHMENIWLQRLPKKLDRDLIAEAQQAKGNAPANEDLAFGWGVHIIEGPNHAVLGLLLAIGVAVAFVVSGMIVGFAKTQEQGFGVGNFLLAILASTMTAVYFQLQD
ncbi:unnamed protein product [Alternaria alternata]